MAVPTMEPLSSLELLRLSTLDESLSRWPSSSSFSTSYSSSSTSRSTSYAGCPTMSKSFTDSMSSDTQTENETPPESPREELQTTPVIISRPIIEHPSRPDLRALFSHVSIYSDSDDANSPDAGYETECDDKQVRGPFGKRSVVRRIHVDRRRGELASHAPASIARARFLSGTKIPTASHLATSTRPSSPKRTSPLNHRPTKISIPASEPPTPPPSRSKAQIGLGLGIGLPSVLSAMRRAPNWVHRSSSDAIPVLPRSLAPVTPADLVTPFPLIPIPTKPRLGPITPPSADAISPLTLPSPFGLNDMGGAPFQPRHAAFSFAHGGKDGSATTAAAILTLASHAQLQNRQTPPSRGSQLQSTPEEVCLGDTARGIRRFEAMNPYFPMMGYRVISG